jgi:hypothetical protein
MVSGSADHASRVPPANRGPSEVTQRFAGASEGVDVESAGAESVLRPMSRPGQAPSHPRLATRRSGEEAELACPGDGLIPCRAAELEVDRLRVRVDRAVGEVELRRGLALGRSGGKQVEHLHLTLGQFRVLIGATVGRDQCVGGLLEAVPQGAWVVARVDQGTCLLQHRALLPVLPWPGAPTRER